MINTIDFLDDIEEYIDKIDMNKEICLVCYSQKIDDKITLDCKHSFCYECILKSYKGKKNNFSSIKSNRLCPYCRKQNGYLPLRENIEPIKGIHVNFLTKIDKIYNKCCATIKSGPNKGLNCTNNSKLIINNKHYCGKHKPK